jgi:ParB family chromosome partitioning protein
MSGRVLQPIGHSSEELNLAKVIYQELPVDKIVPGRNPRQNIDEQSLVSLVKSIKQKGMLQPILVQPTGLPGSRRTDESYSIICGERRYRAALVAGLTTIPAMIRTRISDGEAIALAFVENQEREALNPIEQAQCFRQLERLGYKQKQIGMLVGYSQPAVANIIRLLKLPEHIQQNIVMGELTMSHGKELLRYADQPELLDEYAARALSGTTTKQLAGLVEADPGLGTAQPRKKVQCGERIDFRGMSFAPVNEHGVIYLFGMVSRELGFLVESVRRDYPDCHGHRCVGKDGSRWEDVRIEFECESSSFRYHGHNPDGCDLIVCWIHDWSGCPIEVIELRSEIKRLCSENRS